MKNTPETPKARIVEKGRDTTPRYEGNDLTAVQYGLQKSAYEALVAGDSERLTLLQKRAPSMLGAGVNLVTSSTKAAMDEMVRLARNVNEPPKPN